MAFGKWLAEHPPPDDAFNQSIAGVARRIAAGEGDSQKSSRWPKAVWATASIPPPAFVEELFGP